MQSKSAVVVHFSTLWTHLKCFLKLLWNGLICREKQRGCCWSWHCSETKFRLWLIFLILFNTILPVLHSLVGGQIKIGHQGMWTPEYSISKILAAGLLLIFINTFNCKKMCMTHISEKLRHVVQSAHGGLKVMGCYIIVWDQTCTRL